MPGVMRTILAQNVTRRRDVVFANQTNKDKALAGAARLSLSTVQRIRAAEVGASIDQIEELAKAPRVSVPELLTATMEVRRFLLVAEPEASYDATMRVQEPGGRNLPRKGRKLAK